MPRIQPVNPDTAEGQAKELLAGVKTKLGMAPNVMAGMAQSPAALKAYLDFGAALGNGLLSAQLREQIAITIANTNRCGYCLAAHTAIGKMVGVSADALESSRTAKAADAKVEAALRFARRVVENRGWVSDAEFAEVRDAGYSDGEIAEIIANVALNTYTNYFNHVAETEVDFPEVPLSTTA